MKMNNLSRNNAVGCVGEHSRRDCGSVHPPHEPDDCSRRREEAELSVVQGNPPPHAGGCGSGVQGANLRSENSHTEPVRTGWSETVKPFRRYEQAARVCPLAPAAGALPNPTTSFLRPVLIIITLVGVLARAASADSALVLEAIRKQHDLPALAVVVVKDGKVCDRAAVGVRKLGESTPVTTNDVWHIGSCTKSMTATLGAMLIEAGKLRWDSTIVEVLPELKGKIDLPYESVTVEQLLTHRGGIAGSPPAAAWRQAWQERGTPTEQRMEFIQAVLREPPKAAPGTKTVYSNQGYAIAGAMMERVAGTSWEVLITERLFTPLKMTTAGFGPPGTKQKTDQPWGHTGRGRKAAPSQTDNPPAIAPGGRVHCSLDDLARYTIAHLQGERAGGLLKPETFRKLHTPPEGSDYAGGWVVTRRGWAGGRALTHNGSNTMWYVVIWFAPEKDFAVIAATNIAGPGAEQGCDEVAAAMIQRWLAN